MNDVTKKALYGWNMLDCMKTSKQNLGYYSRDYLDPLIRNLNADQNVKIVEIKTKIIVCRADKHTIVFFFFFFFM